MEKHLTQDLSRLRITFLAASLGVSGAEKQLYYILTSLKGLGADVDLITFQAGEHWEEPIAKAGIPVLSLNKEGDIGRTLAVYDHIWQRKPHFIQSQHLLSGYHAALAGSLAGVQSIGASRGNILDEMSDIGRMGRLCVRLPEHLVVNSLPSYHLAVAQGRPMDSVHYLPNAIEAPELFRISRQGRDAGPVRILTVGRCVKEKRFDRFIRLIASLKEKHGPGILNGVLVGDGPLLPELKALAASLDLSDDDISFEGMTGITEPYYKMADVFVLTSETEGTPNVILEAMAAALPVVSTSVGNIPYVLQHGLEGFAMAKDEPDAMVACISDLIGNRELRGEIGERGRKRVRSDFSTDALAINLLNLYHTLNKGN